MQIGSKFTYLGQNTSFERLETFNTLRTDISGLEHIGKVSTRPVYFNVQTRFPKEESQNYEVSVYCGGENECIRRVSFKQSPLANLRVLNAHFLAAQQISEGRIPDDEDIARYFQEDH